MGAIRAIRTEQSYRDTLARIDALMDAEPGTPEGEELDVLVDLVEHYESKHVPMGYPSAVAAIEFRMEQAGLTRRDLVPYLGSRSKVSEVLAGKRPLSMPMARALHEHLGIPAEVLLRGSSGGASPLEGIDWQRFPLREMAARGWIRNARDLARHAQELVGELISRAGGPHAAALALFRKNDHARANAKTDPYALRAWCWQALAQAGEQRSHLAVKPGAVTRELLTELARLSVFEDGPMRARELLAEHGVAFVVVPHLPRTHLDGAALQLADGTPVVALTLRYDRLDNFWFCLLHELAHVGLHLQAGAGGFVDDLTLRRPRGYEEDPREREADEWAEEAMIPAAVWERSAVRQSATPTAVVGFAAALHIHPAIVAGRIRHERGNYKMLSHFVGRGEVRRLFGLGEAAEEKASSSRR